MIRNRQLVRPPAFALVITLVMLAIAAVLVIGLLISASSDRLTAVSYDQRFQAELAAKSGLEAAKQALYAVPSATSKPRTMNDDFIVVASPDPNGTPAPYFFIGCAEDPADTGTTDYTNPQIRYYPLYSGGTLSSPITVAAGDAPTPTPPSAPSSVASQQFGSSTVYYPKLFPSPAPHANWQLSIRTQWQYVPLPSPVPSPSPMQYRYTYWIEDLAGYVDANVAGNNWNPSGSAHWRPGGYASDEIALFTLFNSALPVDDGSTYAKSLIASAGTNVAYHPLLFTRMSTRLNTTSGSNDDLVCQSSLTANLQTDSEQTIIPFGLGYKNQGSLKTNLNQLISDITANPQVRTADAAIDGAVPPATSPTPAASPIVPTITDNLPNFAKNRQGGLVSLSPSEGYLETIAANIIEYGGSFALTSAPLIGTNATTNNHYRGISVMPFVTEVYELFYWDKGYYQKGTDYYVDVRVRTYVQFWNMFIKDITSGLLTFNDGLAAGIQFGASGPKNIFAKSKISTDSNINLDFSSTTLPNGVGTLGANQNKAVLACERVYTFDVGPSPPKDSNGNPDNTIYIGAQGSPSSTDDTSSSYAVSWNGVVYDRPGSLSITPIGRQHVTITNTSPNNVQMVGTVPGLSSGPTSAETPPYNLGDPRANYYIQTIQWDRPYVGDSSWGGRIYLQNLVNSNWAAAECRLPGWADGGHNSTQGLTPTAVPVVKTTSPLTFSNDPTTLSPTPAPEPLKAPARIAGTGRINSITELSYVYDPFQWSPFTIVPRNSAAVDIGWQNTWKNKFNKADGTYGSHSTLRIGRPEHKSFDVDGTRAWQLLDIFSAGDPADSTTKGAMNNQISTRGHININAANRETLRALGAGIQIGNLNSGDVDLAIQPSAVYGPQNSKSADIFADNVIAQRQKQPFISTSQLAALPGTNGEPFFGNPDQWPSNAPTEWNDAASEQYFAKIYNLTSVRSRNFRVFVTGQYIDPNHLDSNGQPTVIATANKVYEVFLKPTRATTGSNIGQITDEQCVVTYQADVQ